MSNTQDQLNGHNPNASSEQQQAQSEQMLVAARNTITEVSAGEINRSYEIALPGAEGQIAVATIINDLSTANLFAGLNSQAEMVSAVTTRNNALTPMITVILNDGINRGGNPDIVRALSEIFGLVFSSRSKDFGLQVFEMQTVMNPDEEILKTTRAIPDSLRKLGALTGRPFFELKVSPDNALTFADSNELIPQRGIFGGIRKKPGLFLLASNYDRYAQRLASTIDPSIPAYENTLKLMGQDAAAVIEMSKQLLQ